MSARPDLHDPAARGAYARELRAVARPLRVTGFLFLATGVVLVLVRRTAMPTLPVAIPLAALALGVLNILAGVATRRRYHSARTRS